MKLRLICVSCFAFGWGYSSTVSAAEPVQIVTEDVAVGRVLQLVDERLGIMPAVAAAKWHTKAAIYDAARKDAIVRRAGDLAVPMGLAPGPMRQLFEFQTGVAREVQTELHKDWKAHGYSHPEPVSLLAELRSQLDVSTSDLLRAVYVAAPFLQRDDFQTHHANLARHTLHSEGWTEQNRRELMNLLHNVQATHVPTLERIASSGLLRVGTTGDYAPFSLESNGTVSGLDIELAQSLADEFHARAVFVRTSWSSLLDDLTLGSFDVGMSGISVTPERQAQAAFSVPYWSGGKTVLARCADSKRFRAGLDSIDLDTVRVMVNPGGTNEQYVRANIHHAVIIVFQDNRGIFEEILAGHADIMFTDDVEAELQTRRHGGLCRVYPGTLTHSDKAILMSKDPALVGTVNDWLTPVVATKRVQRIAEVYMK
jgi:cyclohexadienyl dehydratase